MEFKQSERHVNWTPERKLAAIERAERLGQLEKMILKSPVTPYVAFTGAVALLGHVGGLIEQIRL